MVSSKFPIAVLGASCILAAAVGGYVATRQNGVPAQAAAMTPAVPEVAATAAGATAAPVDETEAVVRDTTNEAAPAPVPAARSTKTAPARRETPRAPASPPASTTSSAATHQDAAPSLERSWPTGAASQAPTPAVPAPDHTAAAGAEERVELELPRASDPPERILEELVVSADSVLGLQTENRISSETARVEDRVEARVTRDVKVGDRVAIPVGSQAIGSVMLVDRGGKFKERARLGIQFHTLVLGDGTRLPIKTETVYREGEAPGNSSARKIGGATVGGAILGAILGGTKGAAIGATAGAGGGAAVVAAGDRTPAMLPAGTPMTVRVLSPVTVTVEE